MTSVVFSIFMLGFVLGSVFTTLISYFWGP
jgi:hypothetical protein